MTTTEYPHVRGADCAAARASQGNNFTFTCNAQNSYIQDLCPAGGAAAGPSGSPTAPLLPIGTGSASANGSAPGGQPMPFYPGAPGAAPAN